MRASSENRPSPSATILRSAAVRNAMYSQPPPAGRTSIRAANAPSMHRIIRSQARADRPADRLSDLDLAVIVTDPSIYLFDTTWLREFGEPCLTFVESTAVGNFRERRVLFRDGRDVDFSMLPAVAVQQMLEQQVPRKSLMFSAEVSEFASMKMV